METYKFPHVGSVYCGPGVSKTTGKIVAYEHISKVLVVTDKFLLDQGIINGVLDSLRSEGISFEIFSDVRPNPLISNVLACYEIMRSTKCEAVVAIGGGSAIDCSKMVTMLMTNPLPLEQYFGVDKVPMNPYPLFAIPTTSGTGSEVTPGGIVVNDETGMKGGIVSHRMMAKAAIIDPELVLTLPPELTASTGMDALAHAVEAFTNVNVSLQSEIFCRESMRLIGKWLRIAYSQGKNMEARLGMAQAAAFAGIGNGPCGVAANHALAYPLENKYHIPHGIANAALLPAVVKFNGIASQEKYREVAVLLGENVDGLSLRDASLKAGDAIRKLSEDLNIPGLSELGVSEDDFRPFAEEALKNERLMPNNPRRVLLNDAIKIYKESF